MQLRFPSTCPSCFVRIEECESKLPLREGVVAIVQDSQSKHLIYYRVEAGGTGKARCRKKQKRSDQVQRGCEPVAQPLIHLNVEREKVRDWEHILYLHAALLHLAFIATHVMLFISVVCFYPAYTKVSVKLSTFANRSRVPQYGAPYPSGSPAVITCPRLLFTDTIFPHLRLPSLQNLTLVIPHSFWKPSGGCAPPGGLKWFCWTRKSGEA
jgi:hypothetical protein